MNERDKLIAELIKEEGGTREQYLSLLDQIAYHESAHTMDPTIKQIGGGPGRGKYQFEAGENRGAITAARRTKRYLDSISGSVPKWLEKAASGDDLDASKLTSAQQDILFLGNMKMHPKADLAKVMEGNESIEEFWANYHWAGPDKDRADRLESFAKSKEKYSQNYTPALKKKTDVLEQPEKSELAFAEPVQDNTNVQNQTFKTSPTILSTEEQQQKHFNPGFDTESLSDVYSFIKNRKAPTDKNLVSFQGGGTHEQNPLGGIPQGIGPNGKPNTVEEGETSFEFGEDKFVFSDRVSLTDYINKSKYSPNNNQFALGGSLNNTDPTDPRLKTKKTQESTKVDLPTYKTKNNPLNINSSTDNVKNYLTKYITSENYKSKLVKSGYENPDKIINMRLDNLDKTDVRYQENNPSFSKQILNKFNNIPYTKQGSAFQHDPKTIIIDNKQVRGMSTLQDPNFATEDVLAHEYGHATVSGNKSNNWEMNLNKKDLNEFEKRIKKENILDAHDGKMDESYSDLLALRYTLNKEGITNGNNITLKDLHKYSETSKTTTFTADRLFRLYEPEDIIWLLNNIADNSKIKKTNSRLT